MAAWFDRWKFWPNFVTILQKQPAARMNGMPKFSCKECRRQFVGNPSNKIIPKETWDIVDKLLLEKISAAGISRVTGISEIWIQKHVNKKYENISKASGAVFKKAV